MAIKVTKALRARVVIEEITTVIDDYRKAEPKVSKLFEIASEGEDIRDLIHELTGILDLKRSLYPAPLLEDFSA